MNSDFNPPGVPFKHQREEAAATLYLSHHRYFRRAADNSVSASSTLGFGSHNQYLKFLFLNLLFLLSHEILCLGYKGPVLFSCTGGTKGMCCRTQTLCLGTTTCMRVTRYANTYSQGWRDGVTGKKADCSCRGPGISSQLSYSSVCNSSCKGSDTVFCPLWAAGGPTHIHLLMTRAKHLPCSLANVPMSTAVLHEVLNIEVYLIDNKWFPSVVSQQHTSDLPQR